MRSAPRSAGYSDRRTRIDDEKDRPEDRTIQAGEVLYWKGFVGPCLPSIESEGLRSLVGLAHNGRVGRLNSLTRTAIPIAAINGVAISNTMDVSLNASHAWGLG